MPRKGSENLSKAPDGGTGGVSGKSEKVDDEEALRRSLYLPEGVQHYAQNVIPYQIKRAKGEKEKIEDEGLPEDVQHHEQNMIADEIKRTKRKREKGRDEGLPEDVQHHKQNVIADEIKRTKREEAKGRTADDDSAQT